MYLSLVYEPTLRGQRTRANAGTLVTESLSIFRYDVKHYNELAIIIMNDSYLTRSP